ncbi:MAG TPA: hypothetical protein PLD27_02675 [bacterium]|nr:hypothetical protein [bacterium]HOL46743.1 hypothetical protein [bacterium]HPQ18179.1 hypothetical protein [bacterium]
MSKFLVILYNLFFINLFYKYFKKKNYSNNLNKFLQTQNIIFNKLKEIDNNKEKKIYVIFLNNYNNEVLFKILDYFENKSFFNVFKFSLLDNSNQYYLPQIIEFKEIKNFFALLQPSFIFDFSNFININIFFLCKKNKIKYYKIYDEKISLLKKFLLKLFTIKTYNFDNKEYLITEFNKQFYYDRN